LNFEITGMKKVFNAPSHSTFAELNLGGDVNHISDAAAFMQLKGEFAQSLNFKYLITPLRVQPLDSSYTKAIKRIADIFFASLVIICVLSWLIPLIGILIKLDSRGPVFFLQKRNKRNGDLFTCIKFRSMIMNDDADILPAEKNDMRITRIGKFLRNHYIDELPQFLNVLWGDMSVIGPRPHMVSDNIKYNRVIRNYDYRHRVKPGITGLAQVLGYVGLIDDMRKIELRVQIDIFYVRHWSPKMDRIILLRTLKKITGR
jgi:putative colanic acid biosynthesis UDP-glucose lipid carrier transferase